MPQQLMHLVQTPACIDQNEAKLFGLFMVATLMLLLKMEQTV
jgi:hypothetical protein